jgi:hypothetical protein
MVKPGVAEVGEGHEAEEAETRSGACNERERRKRIEACGSA